MRKSILEEKQDCRDALSREEIENIQLGIKDIEKGKTMSSEEFWERLII